MQKIQIIRFSVAFDRLNSQPEMEFLYIYLTKVSSLLLHAIHSLSTSGFLNKTKTPLCFKEKHKKTAKDVQESISDNVLTVLSFAFFTLGFCLRTAVISASSFPLHVPSLYSLFWFSNT